MSNVVPSIEELVTAGLPGKTLKSLEVRRELFRAGMEKITRIVTEHPVLFMALENMEIEPSWNSYCGSVDLLFSGDGPKLTAVWKLLRSQGWKPDEHPSGGQRTDFCCYWRKEGYGNIWMNFSSTVCKRVQVGTKMVEQPIYEVQCGDLPALENDNGA